jgi:hypothetical protein
MAASFAGRYRQNRAAVEEAASVDWKCYPAEIMGLS